MKDDTIAHLHDVIQAGKTIKSFLSECSYEEYVESDLIRSAVERKFEIMGEALNRISKDDYHILAAIEDYRDIISFRNILIHGYDSIDDSIVWGVVEEDLDNLIRDAEKLIQQ